jgi:hypothetical protein
MTHRTKLFVGTIIAMVLVICGTLYLRPQVAAPGEKVFSLEIRNHSLARGPAVMSVNQDDKVELHVKSDRATRVMVHGYEKELVVAESGEADLTFVADRSGRFPLHMHENDNHIELAVLEVQPR